MEPRFQTSFIPKKATGNDFERAAAKDDTDIFSLTATIVFLATAVLFGGLFGYRMLLVKQIAQADSEINAAREAIQPEKIKELIEANFRIKSSLALLENHVVTTKLLKILGDSTIQKLRFESLEYKYIVGAPTIKIRSEVLTYNAFAVQQDVISKNEFFKNSTFTNIALGENGNIKYEFSSLVGRDVVSYKKAIESLTATE